MGSVCRDLNIIFIGFGAVLFILLGLFSFLEFETLEIHANKWGKGGPFDKPTTRLAVEFWLSGIMYTAIFCVLIYFNHYRTIPNPGPIP